MLHRVLLFTLIFSLCSCDPKDDKISALEQRVTRLELQLSSLEADLVTRYGLIRRCPLPNLPHGTVKCESEDRVPGTKCKARCYPGYVVTPGMHETTCNEDGLWKVELRCEVPLLVVSGGTVDGNQKADSGVEVVSLHNNTGCEMNVPDMPVTDTGENRIMHNLMYVAHHPVTNPNNVTLLACNGLTQPTVSTCDAWAVGQDEWTMHSNPNKNSYLREMRDSLLGSLKSYKPDLSLSTAGRYAASTLSLDGSPYIVGGMIFNDKKHVPTNTIRLLGKTEHQIHWEESPSRTHRTSMQTKRSFFCTAEHKPGSFMAIGGYTGSVVGTMENLMQRGQNLPSMSVARSGHACTAVEGGNILVSGGSRRDGASALAAAEVFHGEENRWEVVGEMRRMRFGHALVNVGGKIVAVGGKERQPDLVMDNAEEYDLVTKSWRSIGKVLKKPRANFGYALIPHSLIPGCTVFH